MVAEFRRLKGLNGESVNKVPSEGKSGKRC